MCVCCKYLGHTMGPIIACSLQVAGSTTPYVAYVTGAGDPIQLLPYGNASKLAIFQSTLYVSVGNVVYMVGTAGALPQSGAPTVTPILSTTSDADVINSFLWQNSSSIWTCSSLGILQWSSYGSSSFVVVGSFAVTGPCYDLGGAYSAGGVFSFGVSGLFTAPATASVLAYNTQSRVSTVVQSCTHYIGGICEYDGMYMYFVVSVVACRLAHSLCSYGADRGVFDPYPNNYTYSHTDAICDTVSVVDTKWHTDTIAFADIYVLADEITVCDFFSHAIFDALQHRNDFSKRIPDTQL